jgi:hypothetical protein
MGPRVVTEGDSVRVEIPMEMKVRRGRKGIIVPDGLPGARESGARAQEPLVTALARAFRWQELIESGRYASISELADDLGVDRSYVARVMKLACLEQRLVEAIVAGEEPSGMSLEGLVKRIPIIWGSCGASGDQGSRGRDPDTATERRRARR